MAGVRPVLALVFVSGILGGVHGAQYFGKLIGKLSELHHGVSGEVYAVDSRTLYIKDFTYDGQGPAAYFYAGNTRTPGSSGFRLRDEKGSGDVIRKYRKEGVTLTLPEGKTLNNIKIFYVWCEEFAVNFGDVKIPRNFDYPRPVKIDPLQGVHGISSDNIVIVDAQTLLIPNFSYDGEAPDAKFWVGRGSKPSPQGIRVPDENGKEIPLRRYDKKTVVLTLPNELTAFDIGHFGIWCEAFTVDFGHVQIPEDLNVPPSLKMLGVSPQSKLNCEVLQDSSAFEVRWALAGDSIVMQLVAKLDDGEYMSFGVSGEDSSSVMINGDIAVSWIDKDTLKGYAEDYFLRDKSQCSGKTGSCPDYRLRENTNNIRMLNAATVNGYSIVTYQRPLQAQDEFDRTIHTNQTTPIIWAIGPLNQRNEVSFHSEYLKRDRFIDFGRSPQWNCPAPEVEQPSMTPVPSPEEVAHVETTSTIPSRSRNSERRRGQTQRGSSSAEAATSESERIPSRTRQQTGRRGSTRVTDRANIEEKPTTEAARAVPTPAPVSERNAWTIPPIQCYEPEDGVFYAQMGPTGGKRGYPAITGHVGWGISWYINGLLIPEINVVRGKTYTFVIEGGLDSNVPAKYHPFYITDDSVGGYEHQSAEERKNIRIFAGARQAKDGSIYPTGTGRLCHWTQKGDQDADDFASFGAYQRTLELKCDQGEPGVIQWTPDKDTPDTVYYQCFTHRYLGWKINVLDTCDEETAASETKLVSVPFPSGEDLANLELYSSPSQRVETMVKHNSISFDDEKDKVTYKISAVEDAVVDFPAKSKKLPLESPYLNPQNFYFNPNPFMANTPTKYQNPYYNQNPYYDQYMMQNSFYKPQYQTFRPSPLIHTGLEQTSFTDSFTPSTNFMSTTTSTTSSTTSTSTTTPLPITSTTLVTTTTSGPKEHLTEAASEGVPKQTMIPSTKPTKKNRPFLRTSYIKIPMTYPNKKPGRHIAALVRPSHQFMNHIKPYNHIMHSASHHYPIKVPINIMSNKPSFRIRPNAVRPNPNSQVILMPKHRSNIHVTKKPSSVIILTPQVKLLTKAPQSLASSAIAVQEVSLHDNISQKTDTVSRTIPETPKEQNVLEIIHPVKTTKIKPHQNSGFHPENINIETGFTPILERSDVLLSSDDITYQEVKNPTIYEQPAFLKSTKPPVVKKLSKYTKRSEPEYFKIKLKFARDLEGTKEKFEDSVAEASSKEIYYLPPDNQKHVPIGSISQPSSIDIIPEESDLETDIAPDVVVTYDGKKVSGASLTAKLADSTRLLESKSLKTSEFIRTRPQSVPFKGELPPLDPTINFERPEFNVRATLNRNLDVPFLPDSSTGVQSHSQGSTKLSPVRLIPHSNGHISRIIRRRRSPHHTPEHTAEQEKEINKNSGYLLRFSLSITLTVVGLQILLVI